ncbi:MAG TPA: hypothetical protein VFE62_26230 [Gemmataceae bacterium]|nr:hypothetical protein [Gemmataceae bacterium]
MGSKILEDFAAQAKPTPKVTDPKLGAEKPPEDDGTIESPDRCGIENRTHPQPGFVLFDSAGVPLGISYAAIENTIRWLEPCALEFVFSDDRGFWRVTIVGKDDRESKRQMEKLQLRLIQQRRELLRMADGAFITSIEVEKIEEEADKND